MRALLWAPCSNEESKILSFLKKKKQKDFYSFWLAPGAVSDLVESPDRTLLDG